MKGMRKNLFIRVLSFVCCLSLVLSSSMAASAVPATSTDVSWYTFENILGVDQKDKELVIRAKVNGIQEKLHLSFPSFGGIRINTDKEGFFLPKATAKITYTNNLDGTLTLNAGTGTTVVLNTTAKPWTLKVLNAENKVITAYSGATILHGYKLGEHNRICIESTLAEGEVIYGMGERFNTVNRVGIQTLTANADCWSEGDNAYKNIPIIHSSKGYTFFFNSGTVAYADIGYTDTSKIYYDAMGQKLDFYVWTGTPLDNLSSYTSLTGTPMLFPKWVYRYMPGATTIGWELQNDAFKSLKESLDGYAALGVDELPCVFGEAAFDGSREIYEYLNEKGMVRFGWTAPFQVSQISTALTYLPGYSSNPADYALPLFKNGSNLDQYSSIDTVDFSHPAAKTLITNAWKPNIDLGMRGMMIDYGEYVGYTNDAVNYVGMQAYEAHNFNSYYYAKVYHDVYNEQAGKGNWFNFIRSGTAGIQRYTGTFGGDQKADFTGMVQSLRGMLSGSACALSNHATLIGGLSTNPTKELYDRWMQMAAFTPIMMAHGSDGAENPWEEGTASVFVEHYWLREALVDKIYNAAIVANKTGAPIVQIMAVAFPYETQLLDNQDQYIFANDFLVCPVTTAGALSRKVDLPAGSWTELRTGKILEGGKAYDVDAPKTYSPVFIRAGSAIPVEVSKTGLSLFENMADEKHEEALLVTAPNGTRTSEFWHDTKTKTQYTNSASGNTFTVSADKAQDCTIVIAQGINAEAVKVDGKALTELGSLPTNESTPGYYVDGRVRTVIRVPKGSWKSVSITAGKSLDVDLAYNKNVTIRDDARETVDGPQNLVDGDLYTNWYITDSAKDFIIIDLEQVREINEVVVKWTKGYAGRYKVHYSTDNKNWKLAKSVNNGDGEIDNIIFNPVMARYVKLSGFADGDVEYSSICDINIYGTLAIGNVPNMNEVPSNQGQSTQTPSNDNGSNTTNKIIEEQTVYKYVIAEGKDKDEPFSFPIEIAILLGATLLLSALAFTGYLIWAKKRTKAAAQTETPPEAQE